MHFWKEFDSWICVHNITIIKALNKDITFFNPFDHVCYWERFECLDIKISNN